MNTTVLVVEDDEAMAEMLSVSLSPRFTVDVCTTKERAISDAKAYLTEQELPDCLVIDLIVNGEGGLDFYEWLRGEGIETPVIFLTGCHPQSPEYLTALETGEALYEKDHFSSQRLAQKIEKLVAGSMG